MNKTLIILRSAALFFGGSIASMAIAFDFASGESPVVHVICWLILLLAFIFTLIDNIESKPEEGSPEKN